MTKVNHKQMHVMLKQQAKALQNQLTPDTQGENVNEIPVNFNQVGWNATIEKVEAMLSKMKQVVTIKGSRLTPQFYRSIYNRALIATVELDRLVETLSTTDSTLNFEAECVKLNAEIYQLNLELAEKAAKE